jgi:hypothetical protein
MSGAFSLIRGIARLFQGPGRRLFLDAQTGTTLPHQQAFEVSFTSTNPGQGMVYFGSGPGCSGLVEVATRDAGAGTTNHRVLVVGNDLFRGHDTDESGTSSFPAYAVVWRQGRVLDRQLCMRLPSMGGRPLIASWSGRTPRR